MIKGVLFDKDGTLIPFESVWHPVFSSVFSRLESHWQVPTEKIDHLKHLSGFTETGFVAESLIQHASTEKLLQKWLTVLKSPLHPVATELTELQLRQLLIEQTLLAKTQIRPLPGVLSTVAKLKRDGFQLGVATADTLHSTQFSLSQAGLLPFFMYIGADDTVSNGKPDPELALGFFRATGLDASEVLMVGDSLADLEFARRASIAFVGLETPYNDPVGFARAGAQTIRKMDELLLLMYNPVGLA
ncbi:MAG: HAD family hydrolase [Clostridia bacterium]|nr:HAD family hydrolase [Clostridia bacterium]